MIIIIILVFRTVLGSQPNRAVGTEISHTHPDPRHA